MSGKLDEVSLITVVEEFPILYDKDQARGQRNAALKNEAWKNVSEILNVSERVCVTRWKSLRDRFGKELRRLQEHPKEVTSWALFPHLLFLKDHYKHGSAKDESLNDIKYQPKKKRSKTVIEYDTQRNTEDDLNPDNILLNQQLIELVKKHPVIYDKQKIRDSNHLTVKNEAWTTISDKLSLPEETCWLRWKKLRDRFSREYRYKKLNPQEHCAWIHYEDLEFLEPHYRKGVPLCLDSLKSKPACIKNQEDSTVSEHSQMDTQNELEFSQITFNVQSNIENDYDYVEHVEEENENLYENSVEDAEDSVILAEEYADEERLESADIETDRTEDENNMQDLKEFIILADKKSKKNETEAESSSSKPLPASDNIDKLKSLISSMGSVLKEAQQCLQALQTEREESPHYKSKFMQKIHILLSDLPDDKRNFAENRIIEFLYEMQIKALNSEEINYKIDK